MVRIKSFWDGVLSGVPPSIRCIIDIKEEGNDQKRMAAVRAAAVTQRRVRWRATRSSAMKDIKESELATTGPHNPTLKVTGH